MYNEFRKIGQEYYCFILTQLKNTGITLLKIMLFTNNLSLKELWRETGSKSNNCCIAVLFLFLRVLYFLFTLYALYLLLDLRS